MELAIIVIVLLGVAIYYGLFDSVQVAADMATDEIKDKRRDQKERLIKSNAKRDINADLVAKAKENMALIDTIDI